MRTYNFESLRRHRVTTEEADQVVDRGVDFEIGPSWRGNDRLCYVGFTLNGRILEVGVEFLSNENEHVFHANDATRHNEKLYWLEHKP